MRLRRGRPYAPLIIAFVAACKTPPRESVPEKPDAAPVASTAPITSTAPPPPVEENAVFPTPPIPAGADPELVTIASAMCAATYREDEKKKVHVGCRKPLPFKGPGRAPDGKIERFTGSDVMTFCEISVGARGSFSDKGKKQLLVTIDNCRDETSNDGWNGSMPGAAAIVENVEGRWKTVATVDGINTDRCRVVHGSEGRDTLLCQSRYDAGSVGTMHYFFTLRLEDGKLDARTVAQLYDDAENWACFAHETQPVFAPTGITKLRIANVAVTPANVLIDVDRAHALPSKTLEAQLRAMCLHPERGATAAGMVPPPARTRIELTGDGKGGFRPSAAAKALLDKWRSESPDVTQVDSAAPAKIDD